MRRKPENPNQLSIDWSGSPAAVPAADGGRETTGRHEAGAAGRGSQPPSSSPTPLVERLPWDFATSFPQPTDAAIDAGVLDASDLVPENLAALHQDFARQCLAALTRLAAVHDARRRGVDPATGRPPPSRAGKERLRRFLGEEPGRLERGYRILVETYENAFGAKAATAFDRFVRARQAGIAVVADARPETAMVSDQRTPTTPHRSSALPVPRPLPTRIATGVFGIDEHDQPVRPGPDEVWAITEAHAEKIAGFLEGLGQVERSLTSTGHGDPARLYVERERLRGEVRSAVEAYAEDFGRDAASQLERHVRHQFRRDSQGR